MASPARRAPDNRPVRDAFRTVGHLLGTFLEVIGLKSLPPPDQREQLDRLRFHHTSFRALLSSNDRFLETVAGLERAAQGDEAVDAEIVRARAVRALADIHRMVSSLNEFSSDRYVELVAVVERLGQRLSTVVQTKSAAPLPRVLELAEVTAADSDVVGGKIANLGEVRNVVGLPTPDGFVVTTAAFHRLCQSIPDAGTELAERSPEARTAAAETMARALADSHLPDDVETALWQGYERLAARSGCRPRVAVRSSALGEDGRHSFAGQYLTLLNVGPDRLVHAYRQVLASLYAPEAVHYRRLHALHEDTASMAVGFLAMVPAVASGVAYSRDPSEPDSDTVLISVVHGLGTELVDGGTAAEEIRVLRLGDAAAVVRTPGAQESVLECNAGEGVRTRRLDGTASRSLLSDNEARGLAGWARTLESHFGAPQDIEWVLDAAVGLSILQSRPLRVAPGPATFSSSTDAEVILRGGQTACPGAASGPAFHAGPEDDLAAFPAGAVLVARRPSPSFVGALSRARAVVTDAGSVTGHMASLARELGVPALLNTGTATRLIRAGAVVTVDATNAIVYAGDVLAGQPAPRGPSAPAVLRPRFKTRTHDLLSAVSDLVVPLNLTDTHSREFTPSACRTLHDVARFVHEKSFEEMFRLGEQLGEVRTASYFLDVFLPMDLYVLDLGGGVRAPARGRKIKPDHVTSIPLQALMRGLLDRRLQRWGPRPIDAGGLLGVIARHAFTSPEEERSFRDPCYALVSDQYVNYTARVGYHFGVVDSFCSPAPNRNYVSFRFRGGAADRVRRQRRARAIGTVLRELGFTVEREGDAVRARLSKATQDETVEQLEAVGRLLQFFRQMDAAMRSDDDIERLAWAFLRSQFDFTDGQG